MTRRQRGERERAREANKSFECVTNVSLQQVGNVSLLGGFLQRKTMRGREEKNKQWVRVCEGKERDATESFSLVGSKFTSLSLSHTHTCPPPRTSHA